MGWIKKRNHRFPVVVIVFRQKRNCHNKEPMVTTLHPKTPHTIKIEFCEEAVSSFGGLILAERMAGRLRLWRMVEGLLPARRGTYDWVTCLKSLVLGLLSGAQGTYATQALRQDAALLKMASLAGAPEEATVWRVLEELGRLQADPEGLPKIQALAARRTLEIMARADLLLEGLFVPVFGDGSLLEGSRRREGTKTLADKGSGLMWSTVFVGPVLAAQRLAGEGEGEHSAVRTMLEEVHARVLRPLKLEKKALVLLDSLHGDDTALTQLEKKLRLHYVAGANKLKKTAATLSDQPDVMWEDTGACEKFGWSASGVCQCWLQCADWSQKRLLVGRRWMRQGEMIWNYSGVMTNLQERDVRAMMERGMSFARAVWRLYDAKAGLETLYQNALSDLALHHPPCQEHRRNSGFYAAGALALTLATAVDMIGGQSPTRACTVRQDGALRKRATPARMRLWRLRRELFALPARIACHAHEMKEQLLGLSEGSRKLFEHYWGHIQRC
jgi:hypothetical protein